MGGWIFAGAAHAMPATPATVAVIAPDGAPVGTAVVVGPDGVRHTVNAEAGTWRVVSLQEEDGVERVLVRNMRFPIVVVAPGYAPREVELVVRRRPVEVPLEPLVWASDAPSDIERRVRAEVEAWRAASEAFVVQPSDTLAHRREVARRRVAQLSEDWLAWVEETGADRAVAEAVCRSTTDHPRRCEP